jgi:hypothetical protein
MAWILLGLGDGLILLGFRHSLDTIGLGTWLGYCWAWDMAWIQGMVAMLPGNELRHGAWARHCVASQGNVVSSQATSLADMGIGQDIVPHHKATWSVHRQRARIMSDLE